MAIAGRKRTASAVRLVMGARGRHTNTAEPRPGGVPRPPLKLTGRPRWYWRTYIEPAYWLTAADSQKAFMWVHMATEYEDSLPPSITPMLSARVAQLRYLGSELGLDPASRARLGGDTQPDVAADDPAARFL